MCIALSVRLAWGSVGCGKDMEENVHKCWTTDSGEKRLLHSLCISVC